MALTLKLDPIEDLPRTPASDVKKLGWRGVMKAIGRKGKVVVTNHNEPEAVILSAEEYGSIMRALHEAVSKNESALDALRHRFDERLASLQAAFEKDCGEAEVVNAICKPTDKPTEFACDYALKGDSMFDLKHVVIAEDGDSFKFVDVPNHCTSQ